MQDHQYSGKTLKGAAIFGFGNIIPLSLIDNDHIRYNHEQNYQYQAPQLRRQDSIDNPVIPTFSEFIANAPTLTNSPTNELEVIDENNNNTNSFNNNHSNSKVKTQEISNVILQDISQPRTRTITTESGFSSPTRIASTSDFKNLDSVLSPMNVDKPDEDTRNNHCAKTLNDYDFNDNLMNHIIQRAEIGRLTMGIDDI